MTGGEEREKEKLEDADCLSNSLRNGSKCRGGYISPTPIVWPKEGSSSHNQFCPKSEGHLVLARKILVWKLAYRLLATLQSFEKQCGSEMSSQSETAMCRYLIIFSATPGEPLSLCFFYLEGCTTPIIL